MKKIELPMELKTWLEETALLLSKETLKLIKNHKKPKSDFDLNDVLVYVYVEKLIAQLVEGALSSHESFPSMNNQQRYDHSVEKFKIVKINLQNEIARGFEQGFKLFNNTVAPEYLCSISVVPEPLNKLPC